MIVCCYRCCLRHVDKSAWTTRTILANESCSTLVRRSCACLYAVEQTDARCTFAYHMSGPCVGSTLRCLTRMTPARDASSIDEKRAKLQPINAAFIAPRNSAIGAVGSKFISSKANGTRNVVVACRVVSCRECVALTRVYCFA